MTSIINRRLLDWSIGFLGLSIVVAGMTAIDKTAREYLINTLHGDLPTLPHWLSYQVLAKQVADVLPIDNGPFVAFGVFALVLVFAMFKM
jgi:hypothetical protein